MFPESGGRWRTTISSVTTPAHYYVRATGARSYRYNIDVITVPKIESVRWRITPPKYTNGPVYDGPLPKDGLAGLTGTLVEFWPTSNRPLSGGAMQFTAAPGNAPTTMPATAPITQSLSPTAPDSKQVYGSFTIRQSGKLTARVIDTAGQPSTDVVTAPVSLLTDSRPFVRILEPKPQSLATPETTLQVLILAEDDYGISRLQLFRGLNESRVRDMNIPVPKPAAKRFAATVPLPLSEYGVGPGDVVKLFARVEDNDPNGAKGSESPITVVQIISQEDMQKLLVAQQGLETLLSKYEQVNRRLEAILEQLEKIQKELENLKHAKDIPDSVRRELEKLAEDLEQNARDLGKLADEKLPFDIDKALTEQLRKMAETMAEAAKDAEKLAKTTPLPAGVGAAEAKGLAEKLGKKREEFKKEVDEPLEHLAKIFPVKEDEAEFVAVYERQRDLADRMASLEGVNGQDDPAAKARMRELEEEQRQIREDLRTLLDKIDSDAAQLPDDPKLETLRTTAKRFAQAVRESPAGAAHVGGRGGPRGIRRIARA